MFLCNSWTLYVFISYYLGVMSCFFELLFKTRIFFSFFFNDTATTEIYTLSLHDALPISFLAKYECISNRRLSFWDKENPCVCTSLVAQWLRIRLPMQGTRVQALVREDPTCHGTIKPMYHNYWARAPTVCALQQEKPLQWEARAPQRRVAPAHLN